MAREEVVFVCPECAHEDAFVNYTSRRRVLYDQTGTWHRDWGTDNIDEEEQDCDWIDETYACPNCDESMSFDEAEAAFYTKGSKEYYKALGTQAEPAVEVLPNE